MIDTHAHLTDERFAGEVEAVLERAAAAGVEAVVTIGTQPESSRAAVELARRMPSVFATVGIHPHSAHGADDDAFAEVERLSREPKVVALGEMGLDYHYDFSPRDVQREVFSRQLDLAQRVDLPVVVHSRDSDADLAALLREQGRASRGVLHSFAGGPELLATALEAGWFVSVSGMVTFRSYAGAELVREVPLDRLMVETDSPYLTPAPHRGRRNEPAFVPLVAARVAEILGMPLERVAEATDRNARAFYRLPI